MTIVTIIGLVIDFFNVDETTKNTYMKVVLLLFFTLQVPEGVRQLPEVVVRA
jgi:hypothetical protein